MYIQPGGTLEDMGVSLRGQPKFNGALVPGMNGTKLGVQNQNTTLVSFEGPLQSIEVGVGRGLCRLGLLGTCDEYVSAHQRFLSGASSTALCLITHADMLNARSPKTHTRPHRNHRTQVNQLANFTWQYLGLGNTSCTIDGRPVANQPATGQCVSPLSVNVTNANRHNLVVTMRDVCGTTLRNTMNFSVAEGWTLEGTDPPPEDDGLRALPKRVDGVRSGAGARRGGPAAAVAAVAAAAAVGALWL